MKHELTSRDEISKKILTARTVGKDAHTPGLSPSGQFTQAYEAARIWCEIVLRAEGMRVGSGGGHHERTIKLAAEILGDESEPVMKFLDRARKARNAVMYDGEVLQISPTDARDILQVLDNFQNAVASWLQTNHPDLLPLL